MTTIDLEILDNVHSEDEAPRLGLARLAPEQLDACAAAATRPRMMRSPVAPRSLC